MNKEKVEAGALQYLKNTDWIVLKHLEQGTAIPERVKTRRAHARTVLSIDETHAANADKFYAIQDHEAAFESLIVD